MPAYEIYIDDDRYRVPSLYLIEAKDESAARRLLEKLWRDSDHHLGAELRLNGVFLHGAGTLAVDQIGGGREAGGANDTGAAAL